MATASTERIRSALEQAGVRKPLSQRDWVAPLLAAALLGLLGWIALSIHEMNARLGVVETRLIAVEEGQAKASEERRALEDRLGGRIDDLARRLPPPR